MVASAQGLDVSNFQGRFNWAGTSGLSFGMCRVTQGLGSAAKSPDPDLAWNWSAIHGKGLHRGGYHFLDPHLNGAAQAESFIAALHAHGLAPADMLWLDNEMAGSSPSVVSSCARAFMTELDKLAPHNPRGVYTFRNFAEAGNCAGLGSRPLWMAAPAASAPPAPSPWAKWAFWQFGTRNGADADAYNGTAAQLDAWIAGFAPPVSWSPGVVRHLADGKQSLQQAATNRGGWEAAITASRTHLNAHNLAAFNSYVMGNKTPANIPHNVTHPMPKDMVYWTEH